MKKKYGPKEKEGRSISAPMNNAGLTERIILFSRFLKEHGFKVFSSSVVDALRSLEQGGIGDRQHFFHILRANFVSTDVEWKVFGELFEAFWRRAPREEERQEESRPEGLPECRQDTIPEQMLETGREEKADRGVKSEKESLEGALYSPVAVLEKRDLSCFDRRDIQIAQLVLKNMMLPFRLSATRRWKRSNSGSVSVRQP